jgi:hypothetical protein
MNDAEFAEFRMGFFDRLLHGPRFGNVPDGPAILDGVLNVAHAAMRRSREGVDLIGHSPLPWEDGYDEERNKRDVEEFIRQHPPADSPEPAAPSSAREPVPPPSE